MEKCNRQWIEGWMCLPCSILLSEGLRSTSQVSRTVAPEGGYGREERAGRLVGRLGRRKRTQSNGEGFLAKRGESASVQQQADGAVYGIITAGMKVDDTELLATLKRERKMPYKDISDEEKIEAANEIHEWLTGRREEKGEA